jgi:Fic family protein
MDKITKYDRIALKDRLKVDWTYSSNAIEGNTISLGDTAYIIQYGLTIKGKSIAEHNEVIGHAKAIE